MCKKLNNEKHSMNANAVKRDYWPTEKWQTTNPESVGMRTDKLFEINDLLNSHYRTVNGLVVIRNGYIIFERYNNGFGPDMPHNVASVTKSVISALIGIAVDDGYITSVDQKVLDFFPEYSQNVNDIQKRAITLKHLLTMTAPIASKTTGNRWEPLDRLRRQRDWTKYILGLLGKNGQIGKFQYSTAGVHLLSVIITRTTGMCAREFANHRLFNPTGMKEIPDHEVSSFSFDYMFGKNANGWIKDPQGNSVGGLGLTLTPRDMARFGFLYLNEGVWNNKQVLSKKWVDESIAPNNNNYGYLWWLKNASDLYVYSALGSGGNTICCIPEKDLVVAITSKIARKPRDPWLLIERCIIPAILD